jgi:hypothetical protein
MIVISRRLCRDIIFAALTVLLTGTTPTYAGCTVFEHRDWGGARFRLNDKLADDGGVFRRHWQYEWRAWLLSAQLER